MTRILPSAIADDCPICRSSASLRLVHQFEYEPYYVVGCKECSVQTILPHPTKEEIIEFYLGYTTTRTPDEQIPFLVERNLELFEQLWLHWRLPLDFPATRYMEVGFGNGAGVLAA